MQKILLIIFYMVSFCFLTSCATVSPPPVQAQRRYTWPQGADEPRIEWIGVFGSSKQLKKTGPTLFNKLIGEEDVVALDRPIGITANPEKRSVYVSDVGKGQVLEFDFASLDVHQLGDPDVMHSLHIPIGLSIDTEGLVYVADDYSKKIYVVSQEKKTVRIINVADAVSSIGFFVVDKVRKRVILPDYSKHKVAVFSLEGHHLFTFGRFGSGDGEFNHPNAVAVEKDGTIVVGDSFNSRIQRFSADGVFKSKFGKRGDGAGDLALIKGVAVDSEDHIYVTDGRQNKVTIFSNDGTGLMTFGDTYSQGTASVFGIGGFFVPQQIYIDQNDRIYIADQFNNRFQVFQYLNADYLRRYPLSGPTKPMFDVAR